MFLEIHSLVELAHSSTENRVELFYGEGEYKGVRVLYWVSTVDGKGTQVGKYMQLYTLFGGTYIDGVCLYIQVT